MLRHFQRKVRIIGIVPQRSVRWRHIDWRLRFSVVGSAIAISVSSNSPPANDYSAAQWLKTDFVEGRANRFSCLAGGYRFRRWYPSRTRSLSASVFFDHHIPARRGIFARLTQDVRCLCTIYVTSSPDSSLASINCSTSWSNTARCLRTMDRALSNCCSMTS